MAWTTSVIEIVLKRASYGTRGDLLRFVAGLAPHFSWSRRGRAPMAAPDSVIVLDDGSSSGDEPSEAEMAADEAHRWRGLDSSAVYQSALRKALEMVSSLDGAAAAQSTVSTSTTVAKTKTFVSRKPRARVVTEMERQIRQHATMRKVRSGARKQAMSTTRNLVVPVGRAGGAMPMHSRKQCITQHKDAALEAATPPMPGHRAKGKAALQGFLDRSARGSAVELSSSDDDEDDNEEARGELRELVGSDFFSSSDSSMSARHEVSCSSSSASPLSVARSKALGKSREITQSRVDCPMRPEKRWRKRRRAQPFVADHVSLEEIQAQEAEFARLRHEKAMQDSVSATGSRNSPGAGMPHRRFRRSGTFASDDNSCRFAPMPGSRKAPCLDAAQPNLDAMRVDEMSSQPTAKLLSSSDSFSKAVRASSSRLSFFGKGYSDMAKRDVAPINILPCAEVQPYTRPSDETLDCFDITGTLQHKCRFLDSFGHSQSFADSFSMRDNADRPSQVEANVQQVLNEVAPIAVACSERKKQAFLAATRRQVAASIHALGLHHRELRNKTPPLAVRFPTAFTWSSSTAASASPSLPIFTEGHGAPFVQERRMSPKVCITLPRVVPRCVGITYIGVDRNARADDDPALLFHSAEFALDPVDHQPVSDVVETTAERFHFSPRAIEDEVAEYVLRAVVAQCGDSDLVFRALKQFGGFTQPMTDYDALKQLVDAQRVAADRIVDAQDVQMTFRQPLLRLYPMLKPRSEQTMTERLIAAPTFFDSHAVRHILETGGGDGSRSELGIPDGVAEYTQLVRSYRTQLCRLCYRYNCREHGIHYPLPTRRVDPAPARFPTSRGRSRAIASDQSQRDEVIEIDDDDDEEDENMDEADEVDENETKRVATSSAKRSDLTPVRNGTSDTLVAYLDHACANLSRTTLAACLSPDVACSAQCWKVAPLRADRDEMVNDATMDVLVETLAQNMGMNACVVALVVKVIPCNQVHRRIAILGSKSTRSGAAHRRHWHDVPKRNGTHMHRVAFQSTINTELLMRTRTQRLLDRGASHAYKPCDHSGICGSLACSCIGRDHMCEKACSCPRDCPNRFRGCSCEPNTCRSEACPCFAAKRECDPDVCDSCGAAGVALLPFACAGDRIVSSSSQRGHAGDLVTCPNVNLQRRYHKKVGIARSRVHGYGAFALEPIRRGEFVYEYTGELISVDESERRGTLADRNRIGMFYLFDADEDETVDGLRQGNKSRYINHAPSSQANLEARCVQVGGDHCVTLWAKTDIPVGRELSFNYGTKSNLPQDDEYANDQLSLEIDLSQKKVSIAASTSITWT